MAGRRGKPALAWLCFGVLSLLLEMPTVALIRAHYLREEPYFSCPVYFSGSNIPLRNDFYGKGYYGASRNGGRKHQGIDIRVPIGEQVLTSKSGRVSATAEENGYGKWVEIHHPDGLVSRYAHLSLIRVAEGDWVSKGKLIGLSGKSGNAANPHVIPHVHFEIRYGGKALNPSLGLLDPDLKLVN